MLGKGGRVENDQVILRADVTQVFYGIGGHLRVGNPIAKVELHVLGGEVHGALRRIDRADLHGTTLGRIDREATRVAEGVEHGAPLRVALHQFAVATLVEEETGLLTLLPIYQKLLAILHDDITLACGVAPQVTIHGTQVGLVGECLRRLVVDGRDAVAVGGANRLGNHLA